MTRPFGGCGVFDCFGAGQKVSQETFGGRSWREATGLARQMSEVFGGGPVTSYVAAVAASELQAGR